MFLLHKLMCRKMCVNAVFLAHLFWCSWTWLSFEADTHMFWLRELCNCATIFWLWVDFYWFHLNKHERHCSLNTLKQMIGVWNYFHIDLELIVNRWSCTSAAKFQKTWKKHPTFWKEPWNLNVSHYLLNPMLNSNQFF